MAFAEKYGPWGIVLGASEGLGEAYARGLAARGLNVVVAARRRGQRTEASARVKVKVTGGRTRHKGSQFSGEDPA